MSDTLQTLEQVAARHRRALAAAGRAGDERAGAAFLAREAGASLGEIAEALGVARPNVPALVRRGERLRSDAPRGSLDPDLSSQGEATPPDPRPTRAGGVRLPDEGEILSSDLPRVCVRGGCDAPAVRGRFCPQHLAG